MSVLKVFKGSYYIETNHLYAKWGSSDPGERSVLQGHVENRNAFQDVEGITGNTGAAMNCQDEDGLVQYIAPKSLLKLRPKISH